MCVVRLVWSVYWVMYDGGYMVCAVCGVWGCGVVYVSWDVNGGPCML